MNKLVYLIPWKIPFAAWKTEGEQEQRFESNLLIHALIHCIRGVWVLRHAGAQHETV